MGSAAEAGTPVYPPKLRLRQDSQNRDLFFFEPMDTGSVAAGAGPDLSHRFFLDPEGRQTAELEDWLGLVEHRYREGRRAAVPLFINGQVKTGKSYMLNEVLPAVANTNYCSSGSCSGRQQHAGAGAVLSEPNFLRVNCFACDRSSGSGGFLMDLFYRLKRSAANQQLPAAASTPEPSSDPSLDALTVIFAIEDFMERLPRDRLNFLLIDEAQSFYLLERRPLSGDCPPPYDSTPDIRHWYLKPQLDWNAVLDMRRLLEQLLLESPPWVAWAFTGNSMTLSANIAYYPIHDFHVFIDHRCLNLSPTVPMGVLHVAWERLRAHAATRTWMPALPDDLLWRSPPQIATLAYLCHEWRYNHRTASTAAKLVKRTMEYKLIPNLLADLRNLLQVLGQPAAQLALLRQLLDPMGPGVERDKAPLSYTVLLSSFASEDDEGRLHLDYPLLAHVIKEITTETEEVFDCIMEHQWISSPMFRELVVLGECCGGGEEEDHPERFPDSSYEDDLHGLLEDMASELALTPNGLLEADWFIQVLDHRCNSRDGGKANFERDYRAQAGQDVKVGLRWFHALLSNVLSRGSPSEQKQALHGYPPKLTQFHSSGRISEVLTKIHDRSMPSRHSKAPVASAPATPRT